jgi:hypothetical protein
MNNNKLLTTAVAALFGASIANADISLTDNLTLSGFVDASYNNTDTGTGRSENLGLDQIEVDFAFAGESVSAEVHLDSTGSSVNLEQAFASYDLGNGLTVSGGKMLNLLGFESDEPTGLYQYSTAYFGVGADRVQDYYDGIRASFGIEDIAVGISAYDARSANSTADFDLAYEAQVIFSGIENLTVAIGFAENDSAEGLFDVSEAVNVWASYESGQMTVAAEYTDGEASDNAGGTISGDGYLLLANYTINDNAAITVRYSEQDSSDLRGQTELFTISPSYSFTDNFGALIEYSTGEASLNGATVDVDIFAIETTFTF